VSRSRSSFLTGTDSPRSSLRDSIVSLDPSPPYALSLYAYSEKAATRSTETLTHKTPEPELLPQGDVTALDKAPKQPEETVDEETKTVSLNRAGPDASPLSRGEIIEFLSNARDGRPLMVSELHTSDLDRLMNWEGADLNLVARNAPENSLSQSKEDIECEPPAVGGIDQRRERNFSRPLAESSVDEILPDEDWSGSKEPGRSIFQDGHDEHTTYSENEPLNPTIGTTSHESILLPTKDLREVHDELSNLVTTNTASDSMESKDAMEQGRFSSEKARTSQEATDKNTVTYPTGLDKRAKQCPKLRGNQRYQIVVAGDGISGRDALVNQFLSRSNDPTDEEFNCKNCTIDGNDTTIEIVDIVSPVTYYSMRDYHLRSSDGFILVYNISSWLSFDYIERVYHEINRIRDDRSTGCCWPKILVANHTEYKLRQTNGLEEGLQLARKMDCILIESAFKNEGNAIGAAFHDLVREICHLRYKNLSPTTLIGQKIEEQQKPSTTIEPPASQRSLRDIFGWGRPVRQG
jgi:GTPase SAR1 family protein